MIMELTVETLAGLLVRSRLLSAEQRAAMEERWRKEAKDSTGKVKRFTRWLIVNGYATEYQVGALLRGHAGDFFLDEYKILERIGKGRMAGVFKAVHRLGQTVAVKVLPPSKAKDAELLARFQREARLATRLKHPNVVRTFQVGQADVHYLVMEYLEGETLAEVLKRRGRLPPAEAVRLAYQVLAGLQHVHEQGLVHRDVKPANLMLVPAAANEPGNTTLEATVKILDIGLGRALFDDGAPANSDDSPLTVRGAMLGDPEYMAPEQARDAHQVDIRADIYSVGCILYQALTGQSPFPDPNPLRQMIRHATEAPRPISALKVALPEGLERIVLTMLSKDPAQRFPTPERAATALQEFLRGTPVGALEEESPQLQSYLTWLESDVRTPSKPSGKPGGLGDFNSWGSLFQQLLPGETDEEEPLPPLPRPAVPAKSDAAVTADLPVPVKPQAVLPTAAQRKVAGPRRSAAARESPKPAPKSEARAAGQPPRGKAPSTDSANEAESIMVELVPVDPEEFNPRTGTRATMSRRDYLFLATGVGIGAGVVLAAGGLGWLFARLRAAKNQADEGR
jgi:serine/threonine protein kinase